MIEVKVPAESPNIEDILQRIEAKTKRYFYSVFWSPLLLCVPWFVFSE